MFGVPRSALLYYAAGRIYMLCCVRCGVNLVEGKCLSEALFSLCNLKSTNSYDKFMDHRTDRKPHVLRSKKAKLQVRTHVGTQVRMLRQLPTSTFGQTPCLSRFCDLRYKNRNTTTLIIGNTYSLTLGQSKDGWPSSVVSLYDR